MCGATSLLGRIVQNCFEFGRLGYNYKATYCNYSVYKMSPVWKIGIGVTVGILGILALLNI